MWYIPPAREFPIWKQWISLFMGTQKVFPGTGSNMWVLVLRMWAQTPSQASSLPTTQPTSCPKLSFPAGETEKTLTFLCSHEASPSPHCRQDVANQMCTKSKEECEKHYMKHFINNPLFASTLLNLKQAEEAQHHETAIPFHCEYSLLCQGWDEQLWQA